MNQKSCLPTGLGYVGLNQAVTKELVAAGDFEIQVSSQKISASASLRPMYDPEMKKIKC